MSPAWGRSGSAVRMDEPPCEKQSRPSSSQAQLLSGVIPWILPMGVGVAFLSLAKLSSDPRSPLPCSPSNTFPREAGAGRGRVCSEPRSFFLLQREIQCTDLSLIFTDNLQNNWFSDLGNWHHQSCIYSDQRPRCNPVSCLFPLSRPQTSPDNPINPNYLDSEHFSPSLLLPQFLPLSFAPQTDHCKWLLSGLAPECSKSTESSHLE